MVAGVLVGSLLSVSPAPADTDSPAHDLTAEERSAAEKAERSGERVEITSATDERSQVFAEPDGSFTLEQSAVPERVRTANGWEPVDTTLVTAGDGMVQPKASSAEVEFSGGGDAPMARIGIGSKAVELGLARRAARSETGGGPRHLRRRAAGFRPGAHGRNRRFLPSPGGQDTQGR
ncbi:hypothetical protein GCM10009800_14930 [Nocardiopsis rhodophaea]